ncbi:unnamed protein product [Onchocerca flexuosa]|uniref:INCENP_ARK-bind domain-containing protein n=1 Tax=Onchocerca flexuosa TaxID=387005 RepID=A0A183I6N2_9BILA|nr:unnamed protein product [Onchocerca flexuosa]
MPWDASIHEPLRQRLIGGLTDSQMSTMSMLGSLGCGLNRSSLFESRNKHGFSWISPNDLCYMVEPPRPAELDLKIISEAENRSKNARPSHVSCPGELSGRIVTNEIIIPHISGLDDESEEKSEEELQKETEKNDSDLLESAVQNEDSIEDLVVKNNENIRGLMEGTHEKWDSKEQKTDLEPFSELAKCAQRGSEYVKTYRGDQIPDANALRTQSGWSSDEIGESDI